MRSQTTSGDVVLLLQHLLEVFDMVRLSQREATPGKGLWALSGKLVGCECEGNERFRRGVDQ